MARHERVVSAVAAAGLLVMAVLCLAGAPARAEPAAGVTVAVPGGVASQDPRPAPAARPQALGPDQGHRTGSAASRIALIAVAAGAVGAFTVLQAIAWSRHRRAHVVCEVRRRPRARDPWTRTGRSARTPGTRNDRPSHWPC